MSQNVAHPRERIAAKFAHIFLSLDSPYRFKAVFLFEKGLTFSEPFQKKTFLGDVKKVKPFLRKHFYGMSKRFNLQYGVGLMFTI